MSIETRLDRVELAERYLHSALEAVHELRALVFKAETKLEARYYCELLEELEAVLNNHAVSGQ